MSSTTNTQGLLTNVFRPSSVYDTTTQSYTTKLKLVNLDTVTANVITGFSGSFGDPYSNIYLGVNAGNSYLNNRGCTSNTFVGINAGGISSNTAGSVFIGIGAGYASANAVNSILIGANTIGGSSNNIFLGPNLSQAGTVSNLLYIGNGMSRPPTITADLGAAYGHVGIGTMPDTVSPSNMGLEVFGYAYVGKPGSDGRPSGGLGINKIPGSHALDVNGDMYVSDGYFTLAATSDPSTSNSTLLFDTTHPGKKATVNATGGFITTGITAIASNITAGGVMSSYSGFQSYKSTWNSTGNGTTSNITTFTNYGPVLIALRNGNGSAIASIQGLWTGSTFIQTVAPVAVGGVALISNSAYVTISNTSLGNTTIFWSVTAFSAT